MKKEKKYSRLMCYVLLQLLGVFLSGNVYAAFGLVLDEISNSYSGCYLHDNGNGTSTISTTINYKSADGHSGRYRFNARGILVYAYDRNGKPISSSTPATSVTLNGDRHYMIYKGVGYSMFTGSSGRPGNAWFTVQPFVAVIEAVVNNSMISQWPAVALQAGNYTTGDDVGEIKGAAYIARGGSGDGSCKVITNPGTPPPFDINISVSAPDWNLDDLQLGESETTFSRTDQQLCFSYSSADVQSEKFIISASNANGVVSNRYRLRHLSDSTQAVPYSLMLDSGGARLQLPNNSTALPLDDGNRTCFVPTFRTEVGKAIKEGYYSDVLTFTVTTKS